MTASAGAWYRVGAVNVVSGQQAVTGVGSNWQNDVTAIAVGDIFTLDAKTWYEVIAVNSDTSITLDREYEGNTQNSANYAIVRNTSGTILTRVAGQIAVQFNQKQLFLDELRKWLNSDNASEELTDSHGVKKSLKTPAQMVRDHDNKLAEIDAIHPFPWAMRKIEFEAMRAANNEKYAASGFVYLGKHADTVATPPINEGMFTRSEGNFTQTWQANKLWLGRVDSYATGVSKEDSPMLNITGVLIDLFSSNGSQNPYDGASFIVKLPPAEDGTRTYESGAGGGTSFIHATPALAFAAETDTNKVVTDRVDVKSFECFLREINDADPFIYGKGLIQSEALNVNGISTVLDTVRPIEYFAWFEGDTTSRGRGVNWQEATEPQRIAIASDPKNNIYFDDATGKFYQWCLRGRTFAGKGNGDWDVLDMTSSSSGPQFDATKSNNTRIRAQGITNNDAAYNANTGIDYAQVFVDPNVDFAGKNRNTDRGIRVLRDHPNNYDKAVANQCYLYIFGTEPRLNKGGYHPSLNPLGTKGFSNQDGTSSLEWYQSGARKPITRSDCFDYATEGSGYPYTTGKVFGTRVGVAGSISGEVVRVGRPDKRYHDALYASGQGGVCRDMRYPASGLTEEDFAEEDLKIKAGEYRGREVLSITKFIPETVTVGGAALYEPGNAGGSVTFPTSNSDNPRDTDSSVLNNLKATHWLLAGDNGETMVIKRVSQQVDSVRWPFSTNSVYLYGSGVITSEFNSKFPIGTKLWVGAMYPSKVSVAGEFTHTEVIGDPADILLCDDLKEGWLGSWNGFIPDGSTYWSSMELSRPTDVSSLTRVYTNDNGVTWSATSIAINPTTNAPTVNDAPAVGRVEIWNYETKARMTTPQINGVVYGGYKGIGSVFYTSYFDEEFGALLGYSLTGKILTQGGGALAIGTSEMQSKVLNKAGRIAGSPTGSIYPDNIHTPISLAPPTENSSPAFKALNYNVVENQQAFIHYAYAQLTYDATAGDWGDDGKIHIADNQTTMPDENGHTVLVGTACCAEPLGWIKNDK